LATVYSQFRQLREKLDIEEPALEREAKRNASLQSMENSDAKVRCASGQADPSLLASRTSDEKARAVELVKIHPDVVRAVGRIQAASVEMSAIPSGSTMPSRYTVYVRGDRTLYAEVDVTRLEQLPQFTLRCTSTVSPGNRSPGEDPCAKGAK
jgi:hypothetical protein